MLRTSGSKTGWLRAIAQLNGGIRRALVQQHQAREDWKLVFTSLAPGFECYVTPDGFNRSSKADFEESSKRFALVAAAFKERGLQLRREEPSSRAFIAQGVGTIECVVENAEELDFLIAHTDYAQRRDDKIKYYFPHESDGKRSFALRRFRQCSDEAAMELCAEYLKDAKGFVLPRKWEKCRPRFENVQQPELELQHKARYIYSGSVKQE